MSGVARSMMAAAATFVVLISSFGASVAAQSAGVPSSWIDVSDRNVALDELPTTAQRAAEASNFWVGYVFPLREGVRVGCDDRDGRTMSFGSDGLRLHFDTDDDEARVCDDDFGVFLRFDGNASEVVEARMLTLERAEDGLDIAVVWAGEYSSPESVAFLRSAVLRGDGGSGAIGTSSDKVRERLLSAVAVHAGDAATEVVLASLNPSQPEELRESAVFWTSQVGGDEGLERLLDVARNDRSSEVRKQSIFWLGQVAGERATAHLADIAEDDPDTEVRTSAVFALSQSDDEAAIDALVKIVRTHDNREVVKAALFWLGQSGDPRVVALLEELLFGGRE